MVRVAQQWFARSSRDLPRYVNTSSVTWKKRLFGSPLWPHLTSSRQGSTPLTHRGTVYIELTREAMVHFLPHPIKKKTDDMRELDAHRRQCSETFRAIVGSNA
uniref:Uncharacterized protein n=1 Tax=Timema cristinae TaxID=61476 RepID=A0A7R9DA66_TIMCR|nr:unnamed protein product [Timema cristinae]